MNKCRRSIGQSPLTQFWHVRGWHVHPTITLLHKQNVAPESAVCHYSQAHRGHSCMIEISPPKDLPRLILFARFYIFFINTGESRQNCLNEFSSKFGSFQVPPFDCLLSKWEIFAHGHMISHFLDMYFSFAHPVVWWNMMTASCLSNHKAFNALIPG